MTGRRRRRPRRQLRTMKRTTIRREVVMPSTSVHGQHADFLRVGMRHPRDRKNPASNAAMIRKASNQCRADQQRMIACHLFHAGLNPAASALQPGDIGAVGHSPRASGRRPLVGSAGDPDLTHDNARGHCSSVQVTTVFRALCRLLAGSSRRAGAGRGRVQNYDQGLDQGPAHRGAGAATLGRELLALFLFCSSIPE